MENKINLIELNVTYVRTEIKLTKNILIENSGGRST